MNRMNKQMVSLAGILPRRPAVWLAVAAALLATAVSTFAQSEDGIKTAFIYNFAKFVTWPDSAFASGNAPITVGFVGADTLADEFQQNVTGKNANGRDFAIKKFASAAGVEGCQIVFVGDNGQVTAVTGATKGKPILTVGGSDAFVSAGGMINFIDEGGRVGFDLDLTAANAVGLKVDPKLCHVARKVKGG